MLKFFTLDDKRLSRFSYHTEEDINLEEWVGDIASEYLECSGYDDIVFGMVMFMALNKLLPKALTNNYRVLVAHTGTRATAICATKLTAAIESDNLTEL